MSILTVLNERIYVENEFVLSTLCTVCAIFIFCVLDMCNTFFFGLHFGLLRCYANVGKVRNARKAFREARRAAC